MAELNHTQKEVIRGVKKECALSPDGWAYALGVAKWAYPFGMYVKYGGRLVGPTLTSLRRRAKPLVEARDGHYGKQYRLTAAGKRAKTH